ncbi:hypothetical protein BDP81DRAFT_468418 [Colletotrichum phormii]|uniref:Uncharacterized protein n=1 Tax=Colletotrichum phormii TaxID=359342 RepID=A0AAJ0A2Z2_9PEZI|nr:uncharacterized protein BDP81DRAFT_468418 [Colletotrichum phormii]KAK1655139.1 hypothetical protein BDP81DRAFT_468418 [Colletotrichum phormii]
MAIHDFSQEQKICFEDQHRELKRQVPLVDTQEALAKVIQFADDKKFSNIYGDFLNAPLGSVKEEAEAREMLCSAHGISTTSYRPRKDWELVRAAPFIALQADSYWKDLFDKVLLLASSLQDREDNYAESGRARTMDLAASEPTGKLTELLSQYYELYDQSEAEVQARRVCGKTYPWN